MNQLRELASTGKPVELPFPSGFSIGAIVELACLRSTFPKWLQNQIDRWALNACVLRTAIRTFEDGSFPGRDNMWESRYLEYFPIRGQNWTDVVHYHPYQSRFTKAAKAAGFGKIAEALVGALREMADNVTQHSGSNSENAAPGLIGYFVSEGHVAFAVCDIGRGVLASLKENPRWASLQNSKEALMKIVTNHASRRSFGGDGEGFKEVFRSMANLNGIVELRSHEGRIRIAQTTSGRKAEPQFTGFARGMQLNVSCSLSGLPREETFPLDFLT